jgi:hypothetical protein
MLPGLWQCTQCFSRMGATSLAYDTGALSGPSPPSNDSTQPRATVRPVVTVLPSRNSLSAVSR